MRKMREELLAAVRGTANSQAELESYVDSEALQKHFGVSRQTVHDWVHKAGCPHEMRGKILRFKMTAVEDWFRGRPRALKRVR